MAFWRVSLGGSPKIFSSCCAGPSSSGRVNATIITINATGGGILNRKLLPRFSLGGMRGKGVSFMEPLYFPSQVSLSLPFFREINFFCSKGFEHGEEKVARPLSQLQQALVCPLRWYVIPSPLPQFGAVFAWDFRQKKCRFGEPTEQHPDHSQAPPPQTLCSGGERVRSFIV